MKNTITYPMSYALIPEDEMVYLDGGSNARDDVGNDVSGPVGVFGLLGLGAVGIGLLIYDISEDRVRREYEKKTGLSSRNPDGSDTTDYLNYNKRAYVQNRNPYATQSLFLATGLILAAGFAFFLSDNFD